MPPVTVKVLSASDGTPTPHDGRWVQAWDPHTEAGTLALTSTANPREAKVFPSVEVVHRQWRTVSKVQPRRPWDKFPNRPLTGVSLVIDHPPSPAVHDAPEQP